MFDSTQASVTKTTSDPNGDNQPVSMLDEGTHKVDDSPLKITLLDIERLIEAVHQVVNVETLSDLYLLILNQTTTHFGFDYAVISLVDNRNQRVKTEIGKSIKPDLVDPNRWKDKSNYSLNDNDILVDIAKKMAAEIISGPEVEKRWDPRLNKDIYNTYNHKELVRVFVPFVLRRTKPERAEVLGIIEAGWHISTRSEISKEFAALFEIFINHCAGLFREYFLIEERVAFDRIVERVGAERNLLSRAEEIYSSLKEAIEEYLKVDTVTIWEKNTAKSSTEKPFRLRRVAASEFMEKQYDEKDIYELRHDCLTAEAMNRFGQVTEVELNDETMTRLDHAELAKQNRFTSIITIPISIGNETYAVADVFFKQGRQLTEQEKESLEQIARRAVVAMVAVQNTKLVDSFGAISNTLMDEDIETILQSITDSALDVLHANPVILFRYDDEKLQFFPEMISSGYFLFPEVKEVPEEIMESHWPNIILGLEKDAIYFENEERYLEVDREWRGDRFKHDFWHREQIKSSAALRLANDKKPLGIMFVNYRTPQKFNEPTRKLIEAFAAQAASAIARTKQFWETHRRDSFSLSVNEIVTSLAHNSVNLMNTANVRFAKFSEAIRRTGGKSMDRDTVQGLLDELKEPWDEVLADLMRLDEYKKFDTFHEEECQVEDLIDTSLSLLRIRFDKQKTIIKKHYAHPLTPKVRCDSLQVQHMLINLFINSLDAMGRRGTLSVGTEVQDRFVKIWVTDSGTGIPSELRAEIFKPFFTTKKHGSGLGLSISRHIARKHGGRIEFSSNRGKESTFSILLPLRKTKTP